MQGFLFLGFPGSRFCGMRVYTRGLGDALFNRVCFSIVRMRVSIKST